MNLAIANGVLLLLVLLEILISEKFQKKKMPLNEIIFNLNSGHILLWVIRGLELVLLQHISVYYSFDIISSWPYWLQIVGSFIIWDFCFYWFHRIHHKYGALWAVHSVHHQGEHFGLSLGIRNSWYSQLTTVPFFMVLSFMGLPIEIYLLISSIHYSFQFYNHNGIVKNSGFLDKIMITPKHHKVHHGKNDYCHDKNFGSILLIWDVIFGTFQLEKKEEKVEVGVKEYEPVYDPIEANNSPFKSIFKKQTNKVVKVKKEKKRFPVYLTFIAGILLFTMLLMYIHFEENGISNTNKILLFSLIFLGTIANGNMSEGKSWAAILWIVLFGFVNLLFIYLLPMNYLFSIIAVCMALHAFYTIFILSKRHYQN